MSVKKEYKKDTSKKGAGLCREIQINYYLDKKGIARPFWLNIKLRMCKNVVIVMIILLSGAWVTGNKQARINLLIKSIAAEPGFVNLIFGKFYRDKRTATGLKKSCDL